MCRSFDERKLPICTCREADELLGENCFQLAHIFYAKSRKMGLSCFATYKIMCLVLCHLHLCKVGVETQIFQTGDICNCMNNNIKDNLKLSAEWLLNSMHNV